MFQEITKDSDLSFLGIFVSSRPISSNSSLEGVQRGALTFGFSTKGHMELDRCPQTGQKGTSRESRVSSHRNEGPTREPDPGSLCKRF